MVWAGVRSSFSLSWYIQPLLTGKQVAKINIKIYLFNLRIGHDPLFSQFYVQPLGWLFRSSSTCNHSSYFY
jgi:hypothetical protein